MSLHYVAEGDPVRAKNIAEKYGFCLVRGLFSADEMSEMERLLGEECERYSANCPDLYSLPSLRWVMLNERVRAIAHQLLGTTLSYYRETNLVFEKERSSNTLQPYTEFHCDARGTADNLHLRKDYEDGCIYPVYRFAIYFRNYRDHSGGLKVAVGSHVNRGDYFRQYEFQKTVMSLPRVLTRIGNDDFKFPIAPFPILNVPSMPGDLVIFNLRTFHSAGAARFRDRPDFALLPLVEQLMLAEERNHRLFAPIPDGCRNAIFFDYCRPGPDADFYIKWRALTVAGKQPPAPLIDTASTPGIRIRNDRPIVGLSIMLRKRLADAGLNLENLSDLGAVPADVQSAAAQLLSMCETHEEFSPYQPIFDKAAFDALPSSETAARLKIVMKGVQAAVARADEDSRKMDAKN